MYASERMTLTMACPSPTKSTCEGKHASGCGETERTVSTTSVSKGTPQTALTRDSLEVSIWFLSRSKQYADKHGVSSPYKNGRDERGGRRPTSSLGLNTPTVRGTPVSASLTSAKYEPLLPVVIIFGSTFCEIAARTASTWL